MPHWSVCVCVFDDTHDMNLDLVQGSESGEVDVDVDLKEMVLCLRHKISLQIFDCVIIF